MVDKVEELQQHLKDAHDELQAAIFDNKAAVALKLAEAAPSGTFVGGAQNVGANVGGAVAGTLGGVASTVADAVGGVGTVADAAHNAIDSWFSNVRGRLGI